MAENIVVKKIIYKYMNEALRSKYNNLEDKISLSTTGNIKFRFRLPFKIEGKLQQKWAIGDFPFVIYSNFIILCL